MNETTYVESVLAKCRALVKSNFWLREPEMRPQAWLKSFPGHEQLPAAVLLDHFIFFSDQLVDRLFLSAYGELAKLFVKGDFAKGRDDFNAFLSLALITTVEGENPNPSDSGNLFCRKARQVLRVDEKQIVSPEVALKGALTGRPIVFLDDIVGSGQQLLHTWNRKYLNPPVQSFREAYEAAKFPCYYVCLAATVKGLENLSKKKVPVAVLAAHFLDDKYTLKFARGGALAAAFPDLENRIQKLLEAWAPELTVPPYMDKEEYRRFGFHQLGLSLAFQHTVPDSTLPIYWARSPRLTPLIERK